MALKKKDAEKTATVATLEIEVTRAKELENVVMFDMIVNGVTVYGCSYKTFERKDGSGEFAKIDFPSRKGNDGKYYKHVYVKLTDKDVENIETQLNALI